MGTVGALAATLAILRHQLRLVEAQITEVREQYARQVAAWTAPLPSGPGIGLALKNSSSQPVHFLTVVGQTTDGSRVCLRAITPVPPGFEELKRITVDLVPYSCGGLIELHFADSNGHRWFRTPDGRLVLVDAARPSSWHKSGIQAVGAKDVSQ